MIPFSANVFFAGEKKERDLVAEAEKEEHGGRRKAGSPERDRKSFHRYRIDTRGTRLEGALVRRLASRPTYAFHMADEPSTQTPAIERFGLDSPFGLKGRFGMNGPDQLEPPGAYFAIVGQKRGMACHASQAS